MKRVEVPSYPVSIFMAGDISEAKARLVYWIGWYPVCVTVSPTTYVHASGRDEGFVIGLINYPRFPKTPAEVFAIADEMAAWLRTELGQQSYTIQAPDKTVWFSHRPAAS